MTDLTTSAQHEAALAAIEALTGWTPSINIDVDADGNVTHFFMEMKTSIMGGAGAQTMRAYMDSIGRCMLEVEVEAEVQGSTLRQRQQSLATPLPHLLWRRKPEGPRHMLKLAMLYAADNPAAGKAPLRIDVLRAAAAMLAPPR